MLTMMQPTNLMAWRGLLSSWEAWLLTLALAVLVPTLGYVRFRRLMRHTAPVVSAGMKLAFYSKIILSQWLLVAAMLLIARRHGLSVADLGERRGDARLTASVTLGLLAILAVVATILRWRVRRARPEAIAARIGRLARFLPTLGLEMVAFALVCVTAGVCEELLYRGWLVNILWVASGSVWVAVIVGAAMFGIGHAYQGITGMLRTAFIGLQLGALFVAMGSLIPGQVLHAAVNLVAAYLSAAALSRMGAAATQSGLPAS
jgi:membrane protease YdiL (CAAX protease family)